MPETATLKTLPVRDIKIAIDDESGGANLVITVSDEGIVRGFACVMHEVQTLDGKPVPEEG